MENANNDAIIQIVNMMVAIAIIVQFGVKRFKLVIRNVTLIATIFNVSLTGEIV